MSTTNYEKDNPLGQTVLPPEPFPFFENPRYFFLTLYVCQRLKMAATLDGPLVIFFYFFFNEKIIVSIISRLMPVIKLMYYSNSTCRVLSYTSTAIQHD